MNRQSLQALVIDYQLGELSPEIANLLEAHLAMDATAKAEADRILATLETARKTVLMHPELARITDPAAGRLPVSASGDRSWLARAAAILFLATLSGLGGFLAGRTGFSAVPSPGPQAKSAPPVENSPWTRYRIGPNPGGPGLQIVRLENRKANNTVIK